MKLFIDASFLGNNDEPMFCWLSQCYEEISYIHSYRVTITTGKFSLEALVATIGFKESIGNKPSDIEEDP